MVDPADIYRRSFEIIRAEADLDRFPEGLRGLVTRMVHACGQTDLADLVVWGGDPVAVGKAALAAGRPVLVDSRMAGAGIMAKRLAPGSSVIHTTDDPRVDERAKAIGDTRSAAAVDLWIPYLEDAVVAIGNAPTALFRLLDVIAGGAPKPAVILGFPVGFVGAAESKEALISRANGVPFVTVRGRRGGSPLAASAVNALLVGP